MSYVSKLTVRVVVNQIHRHLIQCGMYPLYQSASRQHHTETALLKVANDILVNTKSRHVTLLVLLDFSVAS